MKKKFYSHLVEIDALHTEIDTLDMAPQEKQHLKDLASSNIHQAVIHAILSELAEEDKKVFLHLVEKDTHDAIWKHLAQKATGIEEKIKKTAKDLQNELQNDIKQAKENI